MTVQVPSWVHPSWEPLRAGATLGFTLLVAILGAFSELLGRSGEPPRASWQPLLDSPCWVPSWVHSGSSWEDLGSHLGHLGSHFGIHLVGCHLGCILGAWELLGRSWEPPLAFWEPLWNSPCCGCHLGCIPGGCPWGGATLSLCMTLSRAVFG